MLVMMIIVIAIVLMFMLIAMIVADAASIKIFTVGNPNCFCILHRAAFTIGPFGVRFFKS